MDKILSGSGLTFPAMGIVVLWGGIIGDFKPNQMLMKL